MSSDHPIRIAIIGGGLAGATLANALLKHSHLDVNIFESAVEFSERGAAVGIAVNGQAALEEIGGAVADAIDRAGGVVMTSSRLCMASGPDVMSVVFDLASEKRGKVVHRASLLAELVKPIDEARKHTSKKVIRIDDPGNGQIVIHFNDGTIFEADAVIGADGVRGYVRGHVLGTDHPAVKAKASGFWDARSLVPMQTAKELLTPEFFEVDRQYGWVGEGSFFMHDVLDGGETVQCVLCGMTDDEWGEDEWSRKLDRATLTKIVEEWTTSSLLKNGVIEAMLLNPDLKAFTEQHHEIDAPTYAKGHFCIMGDAAHCSTPWQGSGAGQAIEDAMILETVLKEVRAPSQLTAAFQAYDQIRRPRTQEVIHSSYGTGLIMCGRGEGVGVDMDKIREALPGRWAFIYEQNQADHKQEALDTFKGLCGIS